MFRIPVLCLLCVLMLGAVTSTKPPGMIVEPDYDVIYRAGETVELTCMATGDPAPLYTWQRNGQEFNPSSDDGRIVRIPVVGTLIFYSPEADDEGIYQCFATNEFGTSCSKKVNLKEAKLDSFWNTPDTHHYPLVGQPFTLRCLPPRSIPRPNIFWVTRSPFGQINPVNYDERVSIDGDYNLRFANVLPADNKDGLPYACMVMNPVLRDAKMGPLHYVTPRGDSQEQIPVELMWSHPSDYLGLLGETLSLKCIFSGNPTPDVHWKRADNKSLTDRAQMKSFGQELTISDLQYEDAGVYECWATNSASGNPVGRSIVVIVQSKPYFTVGPEDVESFAGDDVEFTCQASGVPEPDIQWFINGVFLNDVDDPRITGPRFQQLGTNTIRIKDVQETDSMAIQCNATNRHGYWITDAFLHVMLLPMSNQNAITPSTGWLTVTAAAVIISLSSTLSCSTAYL